MRIAAIVVAAGSGARLQSDIPKAYVPYQGKPLLEHSLAVFKDWWPLVQPVILVVNDDHQAHWQAYQQTTTIISGGATRAQSVQNGLAAVQDDADFALIHDAARPHITADSLAKLCAYMEVNADHSGAILANRVADTLKYSEDGIIDKTVDRNHLWHAQTPQLFKKDILQSAFASHGNAAYTDEAELLEQAGHTVMLVPHDRSNIKITWPEDL